MASTKRTLNALVVGDGVVGWCCAAHLQHQGLTTGLLHPDSSGHAASWGNGGHIAIEQVEPLASWSSIATAFSKAYWLGGPVSFPFGDLWHWLPFAVRLVAASGPGKFRNGKAALQSILNESLPSWRRLVERLGDPALLRESGHYVVWESASSAARSRAAWVRRDIGSARFRDMAAGELEATAKATGCQPLAGIWFEGTAQITDLRRLAERMAEHFERSGGTILKAKADAIELHGSRAMVRIGGQCLETDLVVVAAGAWSKGLLQQVEGRIPLIAERGYHLESDGREWPADMPPIVFEDRSMLVTRFANSLRASSFVEFGHPDTGPDPRKWRRLQHHAKQAGVPLGGAPRQWMGARPTLPDYLPAIGRSRCAGNLLYAFGHQHLGLTLAAATGEAIAALAADRLPAFDLTPFAIDRFRCT